MSEEWTSADKECELQGTRVSDIVSQYKHKKYFVTSESHSLALELGVSSLGLSSAIICTIIANWFN
jgi:hypothetical protein